MTYLWHVVSEKWPSFYRWLISFPTSNFPRLKLTKGFFFTYKVYGMSFTVYNVGNYLKSGKTWKAIFTDGWSFCRRLLLIAVWEKKKYINDATYVIQLYFAYQYSVPTNNLVMHPGLWNLGNDYMILLKMKNKVMKFLIFLLKKSRHFCFYSIHRQFVSFIFIIISPHTKRLIWSPLYFLL